MILQSLSAYYNRMAHVGDTSVAAEGFSSEKAHFALVINLSGQLVQVLDLREAKGSKKIPKIVVVPQGTKKSVNISANFLWGNCTYVLGADNKAAEEPDPKKRERTAERTVDCHTAFKELHQTLLASSKSQEATALLAFLSQWNPKDAPKLEHWEEMLKGNLVFQLDGELGFVHDSTAMKQIWQTSLNSAAKGEQRMCLVSGKMAPIARLHPAIKGIRGAESGAALVSFNLNSFCSYGKTQNYNAPISEFKAFAYTTALSYLLASKNHRIEIGDTQTVFWTERDSPVEGFFGMALDPRDASLSDNKELGNFLQSIREGKWPAEYDPGIRFFVLGLSPNAFRLSVRFWHVSTVAEIGAKLGQHFRDLTMTGSRDTEPKYPGMWRLLKETCNQKSSDKNPSPLLGGAVMQSILNGTLYPQELLNAVIGRIRAEQASKNKETGKPIENVNYTRAAIIKAVLTRKKRILKQGMEVSVSLDQENKNPAYLLGRLFAVLEKAQQDAIPSANTTIKDKFYGSASATPRVVFPQLLRLTQHHIAKAEYGKVRDRQIQEIIADVSEFPSHFTIDEQGLFAIGYYHQRQDFYKKNTDQKVKES